MSTYFSLFSRPSKLRSLLPMLLLLAGFRQAGAQTSTQIILYADPNYGGQSVTLGIGTYPDISTTGFPLNTLSSYKIGADVYAYPHSCLNFNGGVNTLNAFTMFNPDVLAQNPSLAGSVWDGIVFVPYIGCSGSTLVDNDTKSLVVLGKNCIPGPNEVAFFDGSNYTLGCKVVGVGDYPEMADAGLLNDWATSLKVGANVKVALFHDIGFGGATTFSKGTSINNLASTIGGNNLSSFKIEPDPAKTWNNNTGNNFWSTIGNWTDGPPPTASDPVAFNATSPSNVNLDVDVVISSLDVADDYPGTINLGSHEIAVSTGISIPQPPSLNAGTGTIKLLNSQPVNVRPPLYNLIFSTTTPAPFNILKTLAVQNKLTINSPVTLLNNGGGEEVQVEGDLEINVPQPPPPPPSAKVPITIKGTLNQNVKTKGLPHIKLQKPSGQAILSDNSEAQILEILSGTLNLNQKTLTVTKPVGVPPSAVLTGKGTINTPKLTMKPSAVLKPGSSPGTLTVVGDLEMEPGAELEFEIAPAGVDMVTVQGAVSIEGANLDIQASAPAPPPSITVIDNDGAEPVSGTFAGLPEGSPVPVSGMPYHISYTGGTGNDVTLSSNAAPVAICQNIVVFAVSDCQASITANDVDNGSHDPDNDPISLAVSPSGPFGLGAHSVTLTVSDNQGGSSSCTATVTVADNTAPTAICQNLNVNLNAGGQATITAAQIGSASTDNCTIFGLEISPGFFDCQNFGANTVTLTATDQSGNSSTCTATVTVADNTAPTAICQNLNVNLNAGGQATVTAAQIGSASTDNCTIFGLEISPGFFDCQNLGANTVTLTATDQSGNSSTCTATVTVADNTAPTAICQNLNVNLNAGGQATVTAAQIGSASTDNCTIFGLEISPGFFNCQNLGANTVTLTATDQSGNSSTCTATVTVLDNTAPTAICQNLNVNLNASGQATVTAAQIGSASIDNCTIFGLEISPGFFDCQNLGANTVTLTATDQSGNSSTCTATVTVADNIAPTITCPAGIVKNSDPGQCSAVTTYTVTTSDNCFASVTRTSGLYSGAAFPVGTTVNHFVSSDSPGNSATCSFTVTVNMSGDPALVHAYTVIGLEDVKMKKNTVQSGGVGVVNAGKKAKLEQNTLVTAALTFVKSPVLDLNSGSAVTTYYPGQVAAGIVPAFQSPSASCNNHVNIPDNSPPTTLPLACYGKITVGKNASATFVGNATVNTKDLDLKENATVLFAQNTTLLVDKKLDTGKGVTISKGGNTVWIFVDDEVKIDDGNSIAANIYARKNFKVEKTPTGNPTYLTGLFIGEKVDSKDNVFWNRDENGCSGGSGGGGGNLVAQNQALVFDARRDGDFSKLNWLSNTGATNDYFVIERAGAYAGLSSPANWQPILKTDGAGAAGEMLYFNELDKNPLRGENFYRLRLVPKNGAEQFSAVRKVVFPEAGFSVYPNPAAAEAWLSMPGFEGRPATVEIYSVSGDLTQALHLNEVGRQPLRLDLAGFDSGFYTISVESVGVKRTLKLVVGKR